jgi:Protein of unknown function (DUF3365)
MVALSLLWTAPTLAANEVEAEAAKHLIELVKIGRVIVSEQMENINDSSKADKEFTGDNLAGQVIERFKKTTRLDLRIPNVVPNAQMYLAFVQSEKEVVDEAQPIINRPGIGFKGFTPEVFTRRLAERFYAGFGVRMKILAMDYKHADTKPDDFEAEVLQMFSDSRHPKRQSYVRSTVHDARPVLRMMDPEYTSPTCLGCHGSPKGNRNVAGLKKDGWLDGELVGAISIILPLR